MQFCIPRNPRCNGQAERFNRTLYEGNWDLNLGCLAFAYRSTPQEYSRLTPFMLMMGREARLPAELMHGAQCNEYEEMQSYGEHADQLRTRMQHEHEIERRHLQAEVGLNAMNMRKCKVMGSMLINFVPECSMRMKLSGGICKQRYMIQSFLCISIIWEIVFGSK